MSLDASILTGASVLTGAQGAGGGGNVASPDGSVIVAKSGSTSNVTQNGVAQLVDSYGSVNDSPAIQSQLNAIAARSHAGGVLQMPAGTHRADTTINVPAGVSIIGPGKGACTVDNGRNAGDCFKLTDPYACRLAGFTIGASTLRTAGAIAVHIIGGNPAIQPFFSGGGYILSANESEVEVDLANQYDGVVVENNSTTAAAWLVRILRGLYNQQNGGDAIRINCPGTSSATAYGASFFVEEVFAYGKSATGNGLNILGAGDFTISRFQCANFSIGCQIAPPPSGRLTTGRFRACQFDTSGTYCLSIAPDQAAVFGDLDFDGCWFAGGGTHNVLINSQAGATGSSQKAIRFRGSFFFDAAQYGLVLTGGGTGAQFIHVSGCQFAGAGTGGFRAVNARNFQVIGNQFFPTIFPPTSTMPQAVTCDAGTQDFIIAENDWHLATAGLLDNSGSVNKVIANNLS